MEDFGPGRKGFKWCYCFSQAANSNMRAMPYWKPLIIDGREINLDHLEPFSFPIVPKGWADGALVRVAFNNHCFTEKFAKELHGTPLSIAHVPAHEERGFDQTRYELSKELPAQIRSLDGQRIAQTRTSTLVRVTLASGLVYGIFFVLRRREKALCELFVLSAYPLERAVRSIVTTGEMKFNVAVAKVLEGKKLKFPPGRF